MPIRRLASIMVAATCLTALPAYADQAGRKPVRCVSLSQIDSTEVVDDKTILFRMRGGQYYRNSLPYRCPSLKFEKSFLYKTSISQLCNVDIIYVLERYGGNYQQGAGCGLGMFEPVDKPVKPARAAQ